MTLQELLDFNPKTQKELIGFVKANELSFKKETYKINVYGLVLSDFGEVEVCYARNGSMITYINVSIKKTSTEFATIKELCYSMFGKPVMDYTNHETRNPQIVWSKGHLYAPNYDNSVYVVGQPFDIHDALVDRGKVAGVLPVFAISMLGGLVWGLLFFALFGLGYGHSSLLFKLSMGGGVVFGLVMFLALLIIPRFEKNTSEKAKEATFKNRDVEMLDEYGRKSFPESLFSLAKISYSVNNRSREYTAKLFIDNSGAHIACVKRGRIATSFISYSEIRNFWGSEELSCLVISCKDGSYTSAWHVKENIKEMIAFIEECLGYNSEKFVSICDAIYDCVVEYDPASYIALGGDPQVFKNNARELARSLILMDKTDFKSVETVICGVLLDDYAGSFKELERNIYDSLVEKGLI